jgi:tetratricopeptide (TPR) repeat protein
MRRLITPSTVVPCAIIAVVIAMVVSANIREGRSQGRPSTALPALGAPGAPATSRAGLDRRIADMEARLAAQPDDVGASVLLADALLRQSRVTGNAGLNMRAEQVLDRARREAPEHYDVLRMQGSLYLSQHRFKEAIAVAQKCRAMRPADAFNYGVLGDARLELGDYDEAFDAFDRMMQLRPSAASYARVAYARELRGDLEGALESMKLAAEASVGGDIEGNAWYHSQVGEVYLRLDRPSDALQEFAIASQAFPGHPFAVAGYAKALDQMGKRDDAAALLKDLVSRAPTPDLHAALGDLLARQGKQDEAEKQFALAEAAWRSDAPEPKNLARFLAQRGRKIDEAVSIAEAAAEARHDIFTEDALAWAYFKAGRIDQAKAAIARARRTGSRDRDILRHAAAIDAASLRMANGRGGQPQLSCAACGAPTSSQD